MHPLEVISSVWYPNLIWGKTLLYSHFSPICRRFSWSTTTSTIRCCAGVTESFFNHSHSPTRKNGYIAILPPSLDRRENDESKINLKFRAGRVHSCRRERFADGCVKQTDRFGGGGVMVWGGITQENKMFCEVFRLHWRHARAHWSLAILCRLFNPIPLRGRREQRPDWRNRLWTAWGVELLMSERLTLK
jgi:hypothetical protein